MGRRGGENGGEKGREVKRGVDEHRRVGRGVGGSWSDAANRK